jgi:hypothetical protein
MVVSGCVRGDQPGAEWVILLACDIKLSLSQPFLIVQERFCLDTYG